MSTKKKATKKKPATKKKITKPANKKDGKKAAANIESGDKIEQKGPESVPPVDDVNFKDEIKWRKLMFSVHAEQKNGLLFFTNSIATSLNSLAGMSLATLQGTMIPLAQYNELAQKAESVYNRNQELEAYVKTLQNQYLQVQTQYNSLLQQVNNQGGLANVPR